MSGIGLVADHENNAEKFCLTHLEFLKYAAPKNEIEDAFLVVSLIGHYPKRLRNLAPPTMGKIIFSL